MLRPQFEPELIREERVILLRRLKHPVNSEMSWYRNQVVERVNGRRITCLEDLVETIENHQGDNHQYPNPHQDTDQEPVAFHALILLSLEMELVKLYSKKFLIR